MEKPKVSVVLTTCQGARFLPELLGSLCSQTRLPEEILVSDDCSTDDSLSILRSFAEKHPGIRWRIRQNSRRLGWKRNFIQTIADAEGEILFCADQDDVWERDKIERMVACMTEHPEIRVLGCDDVTIDAAGNVTGRRRMRYPAGDAPLERIPLTPTFYESVRPGCGIAIRRDMAQLLVEYWAENCAHDALAWSLGVLDGSAWVLHRDLLRYRIHASNTTKKKNTRQEHLESLEMQVQNARQCAAWLQDRGETSGQRCRVVSDALRFFTLRQEAVSRRSLRTLLKVLPYRRCYTYLPSFLKDLWFLMEK